MAFDQVSQGFSFSYRIINTLCLLSYINLNFSSANCKGEVWQRQDAFNRNLYGLRKRGHNAGLRSK